MRCDAVPQLQTRTLTAHYTALMATSHSDGVDVSTTTRSASLGDAAAQLRELSVHARDTGEAVRLTDEDGDELVALAPITVLGEATRARIDDVARAAAAVDSDDVIEHSEAMSRLGLDELGRPLLAA